MAEPVPALDVPLGKQQEQVHSLKEDKPGPLGEPVQPSGLPWQDQDNNRLCGWSRDDQTSQNIESGAGSIQKVQSEIAEDGTRDKATHRTGFKVCPGDQAGDRSFPGLS